MVGAGGEPQQRSGRATIASTGWPTPSGSPQAGRRSHHAAQSLPGSPSRSEARGQSFEYPMMPGADLSRDVMVSAEGDLAGGAPKAPEEKETLGAGIGSSTSAGAGALAGTAGGPGPSPGGAGGATLRRRTVGGASLRRTSSLLDGAVSALAGDILKDADRSSHSAEAETEVGQDSLALGQSPRLGPQTQLRQRHGKGPGAVQGQGQRDAPLANVQGGSGREEAGGRSGREPLPDTPGAPAEGEDEDYGPGFRAAAAFGEVLHRTWSTGGKKKGWNRDSFIGWLAGMLVGEDPRQCYALICKQCCAHNGALHEEHGRSPASLRCSLGYLPCLLTWPSPLPPCLPTIWFGAFMIRGLVGNVKCTLSCFLLSIFSCSILQALLGQRISPTCPMCAPNATFSTRPRGRGPRDSNRRPSPRQRRAPVQVRGRAQPQPRSVRVSLKEELWRKRVRGTKG